MSPKGTIGMALDGASLEAIIEGVPQRLASSKETGPLDSGGKAKTPPPSSGREVQEQLDALNLRPSCQTPFLECDMACPAEGWGGGRGGGGSGGWLLSKQLWGLRTATL